MGIELTDIITTITDKTASFSSNQLICGSSDNNSTPSPVSNNTPSPPSNGTPSPISVIIKEYITQIPLCIEGQDYDRSQMEAFVYQQFSALVQEDDVNVIAVSPGSNKFNFTAQISHQNPGADIYDLAANDLCDNFETIYGATKCSNCDEVKTFALYGYSPTTTSSAAPTTSTTDTPTTSDSATTSLTSTATSSDASTTSTTIIYNPISASSTIKCVSCFISLCFVMFFV